MSIILKNKESLILEDFIFNCSVGKNGLTENKFELENLHNLLSEEKKLLKNKQCNPHFNGGLLFLSFKFGSK